MNINRIHRNMPAPNGLFGGARCTCGPCQRLECWSCGTALQLGRDVLYKCDNKECKTNQQPVEGAAQR